MKKEEKPLGKKLNHIKYWIWFVVSCAFLSGFSIRAESQTHELKPSAVKNPTTRSQSAAAKKRGAKSRPELIGRIAAEGTSKSPDKDIPAEDTSRSSGKSASAQHNSLGLVVVKPTEVKKWGDYSQTIKWKLGKKTKKRGYILQVIEFDYEIRWVENDSLLTEKEVFEKEKEWHTYTELWKISANKDQPAPTLNTDLFQFISIEETYGFMKETGKAYFFETDSTETDMGFGKHQYSPASRYIFSKIGVYNPATTDKTNTIKRVIYVKWDKAGKTTIIEDSLG